MFFKGPIAAGFLLNCNTPFYNSLKEKNPLYCEIWGHSPHRSAERLIRKLCNFSFVVTELPDSFEPQSDGWKKNGKIDFFLFLFEHFPLPRFYTNTSAWTYWGYIRGFTFWKKEKCTTHQLCAHHLAVHGNKPGLFSAIMQIANSYLNDRLYLTWGK